MGFIEAEELPRKRASKVTVWRSIPNLKLRIKRKKEKEREKKDNIELDNGDGNDANGNGSNDLNTDAKGKEKENQNEPPAPPPPHPPPSSQQRAALIADHPDPVMRLAAQKYTLCSPQRNFLFTVFTQNFHTQKSCFKRLFLPKIE